MMCSSIWFISLPRSIKISAWWETTTRVFTVSGVPMWKISSPLNLIFQIARWWNWNKTTAPPLLFWTWPMWSLRKISTESKRSFGLRRRRAWRSAFRNMKVPRKRRRLLSEAFGMQAGAIRTKRCCIAPMPSLVYWRSSVFIGIFPTRLWGAWTSTKERKSRTSFPIWRFWWIKRMMWLFGESSMCQRGALAKPAF